MESITCWLYQIPSIVYAAVMASLITLLGVSLSNRAAHKRLIDQLAIESDERKQEREISLKKDVYLQAAEELSKAQQYIGSLVNSDLANLQSQQKTLESFFSATSKIHIVGSDETIKSTVDVTKKFTVALIEIMTKAMPLHAIKLDIDAFSNLIDDYSSKREKHLNEMTSFNLSGSCDTELWEKLQENFNFVQSEIDKYVEERSNRWLEHNKNQRELMVVCTKEALELAELVVPAVISIRKELDLPFDEKEYKLLMNKQSIEAKKVIQSFLSEVAGNEDA